MHKYSDCFSLGNSKWKVEGSRVEQDVQGYLGKEHNIFILNATMRCEWCGPSFSGPRDRYLDSSG